MGAGPIFQEGMSGRLGGSSSKLTEGGEYSNAGLDAKKQAMKEEAIKKKTKWVEEGKKYIFLERHKEWEKTVEKYVNSDYCGQNVEVAIQIMERLHACENASEIKGIVKTFRKNKFFAATTLIVFEFSPKGPEYYECVSDEIGATIPDETKIIVAMKKAENKIFAETALKRKAEKKAALNSQMSEMNRETAELSDMKGDEMKLPDNKTHE